MSSGTEADVRKETVRKMFQLSPSEKMTRKSFENYAKRQKKSIEQLGEPVEAVYAYAGCMFVADTFGFTKGPEEGGKQMSIEEYVALMVSMPVEDIFFASDVFNTAIFRAIDTDDNGFISREEWSRHLKILDIYKSEEQARKSFDSLDTNSDGKISKQEYLDSCRMFWRVNKQKNLYGTSH